MPSIAREIAFQTICFHHFPTPIDPAGALEVAVARHDPSGDFGAGSRGAAERGPVPWWSAPPAILRLSRCAGRMSHSRTRVPPSIIHDSGMSHLESGILEAR